MTRRSENAAGIIHLACECGADLFFVADRNGVPPEEALLSSFRRQLGPGRHGLFTSRNGQYGHCPYCNLVFELPDSDLVDWLSRLDREAAARFIGYMMNGQEAW